MCAEVQGQGDTTILFTLAAVDTGTNLLNGIAVFSFSGTQLDLSEGYYAGEIEVTYSGGSTETVFKVLNFYIRADF